MHWLLSHSSVPVVGSYEGHKVINKAQGSSNPQKHDEGLSNRQAHVQVIGLVLVELWFPVVQSHSGEDGTDESNGAAQASDEVVDDCPDKASVEDEERDLQQQSEQWERKPHGHEDAECIDDLVECVDVAAE